MSEYGVHEDLTAEDYDLHTNRIAEFIANMLMMNAKNRNPEQNKKVEEIYESLGVAFMALNRERIRRYGMRPED